MDNKEEILIIKYEDLLAQLHAAQNTLIKLSDAAVKKDRPEVAKTFDRHAVAIFKAMSIIESLPEGEQV